MEFQLKTIPILLLMILTGSFNKVDCGSTSLLDVTYEDINALNATCGGLDSCELPRDPGNLEHCSCGRFCSLLGTCCIDSRYRNRYPKPLKNIECEYVYGRKIHRFIPMIKSCDPDLETGKTTEELCKSNDEESTDPFLKIPVTDPITGISYKNYYCFTCNENYGAEEPTPWNLELTIKINDSSVQKLLSDASRKTTVKGHTSSPIPNLQYDIVRRSRVLKITESSVPNLHYDTARKTWVIDHNEENATDVEITTSLPEKLKDVTPVCYTMVFPTISECASDWTDESMKKRCMAYMAMISIDSKNSFFPRYYHNPHCAICNYENLDDMVCYVEEDGYVFPLWESDVLLLRLFSFQDKVARVCEDFMVYDHFAKKCRRIYKAKRLT